MIGITISADQLRTAPIMVRQWIEGEVVAALQLSSSSPNSAEGLAVCSIEEVRAVFSAIQNVVPAVSVFFELGHQGVSVGDGTIEAYRLSELMRYARLSTPDQLLQLLNMINSALQHVRGSPDVSMYGLDGRGHCFIATETRQHINDLWTHLVEGDRSAAEIPAGNGAARPGDNRPETIEARPEGAQ